ncbi:MAG TPA: NAD(P)H-hydrate dehydratase [Nitrososphaerales archaeon]|nr:NAD(P)H-hydrate dehydratase [Nitrososphaerales archaeon]
MNSGRGNPVALIDYTETSDEILKRVIQPRKIESHKGDNGIVGIVGGSRIFHGAPYFTSMAALRTGADLVYLAVPKLIAGSIRSLTPDLIVFPLADAKLTTGAAGAFLKWLPEVDSLVIGPGLGRQKLEGAKKIVSDVCLERKVRVSLDAEAQNKELYSLLRDKGCVTTPHPGEFKRAFGVDAGTDLQEKIQNTKTKAAEFGITIVLKGFETVITDGESVFVNKTGSPAMTCGGIGDTLSGVLAALLAQCSGTDVKTVEIAAAASYIVGSAGRFAAELRGFHIVSTDIIDQIPAVLKPFDRLD